MIEFELCFFPSGEILHYEFDENKPFGELKRELEERQNLEEGSFYIDLDFETMDDGMLLIDSHIEDGDCVDIVDKDMLKTRVEIKDKLNHTQIVERYAPISTFLIMQPDEEKRIKVCW